MSPTAVAPTYSDQHSKSVAKAMNAPEVDHDRARTRRTEAAIKKKRRLAETPTFGLTSEKQRKPSEKAGSD